MDSIEKVDASVIRTSGVARELSVADLPEGLSEEQILILQLYFASRKLAVAILEGNVNRSTVYRWRKNHEAFRAAYAMVEGYLKEELITEAKSLGEDAMLTLRMALARGRHPRLALSVLKMLGIMKEKE